MSISTHDLQPIYRGDSREYNLAFTDSEGDAIEITGWKIYFTVKLSYMDADAAAVINKDITEHYDALNGQTKITRL